MTVPPKKTALVTGAAQGIGKAIALRLAEDGFAVGLNDIKDNTENLEAVADTIKAKGGIATIHIADVSVESQVATMISNVVELHHKIDVLVANAGVCKYAGYCASKFAVRGLVQAAAHEFGPHGITVNAYAPGAIDTDMCNALSRDNSAGMTSKAMQAGSALGITGTTADVAHLVSYLASDSSRFLTGQSVSINGGLYFD
ncbi:NAD-binding protein [Mycena indigotica]|uniref:NAD-binding protein n=1 Tax=Mycena indigotica TaxID=2126181 RepID=A0A8H6W995_9AGAR|nr:NAD-binding protein [Mycena indigotica]KAF7303894.1 NAD-binding protein [Mycena indigotica]